ncbi:MAG TPA: hypothetical protein VKK06_06115 [Terriglobia bacterium]|nr:hypothetical protein [Terriglobia bacterium]
MSRIQGIDPKAQAIIEIIQPYYMGPNFREHPLWQLRELSNFDKHRILHACVVSFTQTFYPLPEFRALGPLMLNDAVIERDTVMARVKRSLFPEGNPKLNVEVGLDISVAFADGPTARMSIRSVLASIGTYITTEILPKLEPFL